MKQKPLDIRNILSPAIGRHMREVPAQASFLLLLRPGVTKVDFIAVGDPKQFRLNSLDESKQAMDLAFENTLEEIKKNGKKELVKLSDSKALFELCRKIVRDAKKSAPNLNDEQQVRNVAVKWLEDESLSLGDAPILPKEPRDRWRCSPNQQAPLRFQDALDWYAGYDCKLGDAKLLNDEERYKDYDDFGVTTNRNTILKVPLSASRANIVTLSNLKLFVAEHLLAYDKILENSPNIEPGLTFFFLPIKGLGQYRAAIDWVGVDGFKVSSSEIARQLDKQASTLQRLGLESLFTQSLIRTFNISLSDALLRRQNGEEQSLNPLYFAFADLWWANEVHFYKNRQVKRILIRAENEDNTTWNISEELNPLKPLDWKPYPGSYMNFFATSGGGHPELTYIKLNISSIVDPVNDNALSIKRALADSEPTKKDLESTIASLPFDEVVFACYFFDPNEADLAEWVNPLAEALISSLINQTIQRSRIIKSTAEKLEGAAHWINSLVRLAGRAGAAQKVERVIKQSDAGASIHADLRRVQDCLQLMVLVEAGAGLLRLIGSLDYGDHDKLRKWFTKTSIAKWSSPSAFETYQQSITHLVRALGSAFGHPYLILSVDGKEKEFSDYCALDLDEIRFPPLSKSEMYNEPILALLPALTEPVANALSYLRVKRLIGSDSPIRLFVEDLRQATPPSILVRIGNPFFEGDQLPVSPGLAKARDLMAVTKLATINDGHVEVVNGQPYYFVPIYLHPQQLAKEVEERDAGYTKKVKAFDYR